MTRERSDLRQAVLCRVLLADSLDRRVDRVLKLEADAAAIRQQLASEVAGLGGAINPALLPRRPKRKK